jgi:hypothetical protein
MGQVVNAWSSVTAVTLSNIFNGTLDNKLTTLTNLVANGQFFSGEGSDPPLVAPQQAIDNLKLNILKAFYGYTIPALWSVSGADVFVIDAGYSCSGTDPNGGLLYMSGSDQTATFYCVNGSSYYLASVLAKEDSLGNYWGTPKGYQSLGADWGNVQLGDLVTG